MWDGADAPGALGWRLQAEVPPLERGTVDLWLLALDGPAGRCEALARLLDPAEQERASRFVRRFDRDRFCVAHGLTRRVLAAYLGRDPNRIAYHYGLRGKPELSGGTALSFNLSHSGAWGLLAVVRAGPVGVDLELVRDIPDHAELARSNFAPGEVLALESLASADRRDAFFACWTRKEALVKSLGDGLFFGLDRFEVSLDPGRPAALLQIDGSMKAARTFSMHAFRPFLHCWCAVVVRGEAPALRCMILNEGLDLA